MTSLVLGALHKGIDISDNLQNDICVVATCNNGVAGACSVGSLSLVRAYWYQCKSPTETTRLHTLCMIRAADVLSQYNTPKIVKLAVTIRTLGPNDP